MHKVTICNSVNLENVTSFNMQGMDALWVEKCKSSKMACHIPKFTRLELSTLFIFNDNMNPDFEKNWCQNFTQTVMFSSVTIQCWKRKCCFDTLGYYFLRKQSQKFQYHIL
jgi:hypothetical protein